MNKEFLDRDRLVNGARDYGQRGWRAGLDTFGDFRKFLLRGNVVDLAVGIVIGAAFTGVVNSFVENLITPLIGRVGGFQFTNLQVQLDGKNILKFDVFLNSIISFLIVAAVVYFLVVKPMNALQDYYNRLSPKQEDAPTTRECPFCISDVNIKATRCAFCTAQLPPMEQPEVQPAAR